MKEWIEWKGGECPIPDAKAGEFEVGLRDGDILSNEGWSAMDYSWHRAGSKGLAHDCEIIAYRLIEPKQSDLDWLEGEVQELYEADFNAPYSSYFQGKTKAFLAILALIKERKETKP